MAPFTFIAWKRAASFSHCYHELKFSGRVILWLNREAFRGLQSLQWGLETSGFKHSRERCFSLVLSKSAEIDFGPLSRVIDVSHQQTICWFTDKHTFSPSLIFFTSAMLCLLSASSFTLLFGLAFSYFPL